MTLEAMRCPSCQAPVQFAPGAQVTECAYCGAQIRDRAGEPAPGGPTLAETIAAKVGVLALPLVHAGASLPAAVDELLSTARDAQAELTLALIAQRPGYVDRALADVVFPIQRRGPRGVPRLHLRVTVAASGAAKAALWEEGADNRQLLELGVLATG